MVDYPEGKYLFKSNYQSDMMKQERVLGTHSSKRDVSIKSLFPEFRKTCSGGDKRVEEPEGIEDIRRTRLSESIEPGSYKLRD